MGWRLLHHQRPLASCRFNFAQTTLRKSYIHRSFALGLLPGAVFLCNTIPTTVLVLNPEEPL